MILKLLQIAILMMIAAPAIGQEIRTDATVKTGSESRLNEHERRLGNVEAIASRNSENIAILDSKVTKLAGGKLGSQIPAVPPLLKSEFTPVVSASFPSSATTFSTPFVNAPVVSSTETISWSTPAPVFSRSQPVATARRPLRSGLLGRNRPQTSCYRDANGSWVCPNR